MFNYYISAFGNGGPSKNADALDGGGGLSQNADTLKGRGGRVETSIAVKYFKLSIN